MMTVVIFHEGQDAETGVPRLFQVTLEVRDYAHLSEIAAEIHSRYLLVEGRND